MKINFQKRKRIILNLSTLIYLIIFLITAVPLFDNSYALKQSQIFRIDSIKLLSRAYYLTLPKSSSKNGLEFQDITQKTFHLEKSNLASDQELKELYDTLQYSKTFLTVYIDKKELDNYRNQNEENNVTVLRISIGEKSFGTIDKINGNMMRKSGYLLIFVTIIYGFFLLIYSEVFQT